MAKTPTLASETICQVQNQVFELTNQLVDDNHLVLAVDFEKEVGAWYLRVYIESHLDKGTSLETCAEISRKLDEPLEGVKALQNFPYSLEVSSPGLFRQLKTAREFEFYQGKNVQVLPLGVDPSEAARPPKPGKPKRADSGWTRCATAFSVE